nr:uncharacterized protein LOC125978107 [Syngnathus scovelli]
MFAREARYPIQVPEHYEVDGTVEDVVGMEVMAQNHNEQDQLFEQVREHIRKAQEKTRHPKTISGTTPTVHIGDLVLRQNIRSQQRKGGKLNPNFLGPYKIVAIEGKTADLQDENGALVPKINIDHLKPCKENKQRVPHRYENKKGASSSPSPPASALPATAPPAAAPPTTASSPTAPPAAAPPSTAPSATAPPASALPATAPPATAPSATAPPAAAPPTTAPSPTAPPAAAPPSTAPTATAPLASAPPVTTPSATAPSATAPPATAPFSPALNTATPPRLSLTFRQTRENVDKYVQDAWKGKHVHVLLSKIGAYKLFFWDIMNVGPKSELESEVINAHLLLLVNQISVEKVSYTDSFAMTNLWNGKSHRLKINPVEYKLIVGIVNEHNHWKLAAIMPGEKRSLLLDHLGESQMDIKKCLESTRAFMRNKGCNVSRWTCGTVPHPRQQDSTSCGVFALKFAEHLLSNEEIDFSAKAHDINRYRLQIATTLLLETDDLSDLCFVCGEATHDTDNRWIQCDECCRWFHLVCVGEPPTEGSFLCTACTEIKC